MDQRIFQGASRQSESESDVVSDTDTDTKVPFRPTSVAKIVFYPTMVGVPFGFHARPPNRGTRKKTDPPAQRPVKQSPQMPADLEDPHVKRAVSCVSLKESVHFVTENKSGLEGSLEAVPCSHRNDKPL